MDSKIAHKIEEKQRTKDIEIDENVTFEEMYLSDNVLKGLHSCGYIRPSPIQLSAIPLGRCGLDLIVQAKSGTGKTCVFTIVALEMISVKALTTQVLIVAPTREIAVQIGQVINSVGSFFPELKASTFIGGINILEDKAKLNCCHIAIGTPGRLNQLVSLGNLNLSNIRLLVLDEADQLLTGQFKNSILELIKTSPLNKQILALSATYPKEVTDFLDQFMRSPSHVRLGKESPGLIGVKQFVRLLPDHPQSFTKHKLKFQELLSVLSLVSFNQCLVFSNSQLRAESVCNQLKNAGWPAAFLTGGQMQKDRLQSFFDLCSYKCRILVSTDLSARGLDSEHVNLVVNMDIPIEQATYLHRIGRAGRFGSIGVAISLACEGDEWEAMRAIVNKTNVVIRILEEEFNSDTLQKDIETLKIVRPLDENNLTQFIEKVNERKLKQNKMKDEVKKLDNKFENFNKYFAEKDISNDKKSHKKNKEKFGSKIQSTEEVSNKDQVCMKTIYSVMNDYTKEKNIVSFSHDEILNQLSEDMKNLVKLDIQEISSSSFVKEYPSKLVFDILDKYIAKKDKNDKTESAQIEKVSDSFDKISSLQKVIDDSQTLQSLKNVIEPLETDNKISKPSASQNEINQETQNKCNEVTLSDSKDIDNCFILSKSHSETDGSSAIGVDSINSHRKKNIEPESVVEKNVDIVLPKTTISKSKEKMYSEDTGFGLWEPVTSESKNDSKCSQFYENSTQQMYNNVDHFGNSTSWYQNPNFNNNYYNNNNNNYYTYSSPSTYHPSIDMYVQSAQKFALMMEYCRNVGRMSAWIAQDNHNKLMKGLGHKKSE